MAGTRPSQKYHLGGRIGGGGMAEVFEATLVGAEGFLRPVAVKRIQPSLSSDPVFGQMFVNEARIASLLHHANIGAVLDFDRDDQGRYFLVMELIRGVDLRRLMDGGRVPIPIAVHIAGEMLRGLDYAHELEQDGMRLGIVHRDISPHNVMVSWDGGVKLVDFGIAKAMAATGISRVGAIKGKVAYMSPEQASAMEIDGRTDVFAVGVVLHEILVGERLFRGNTEPEILARLLTQPIPRPVEKAPHVPADLDAVVMKMLERDRDARFLTAHAALEGLLATSATSPRAGLELEQLLADLFPGEAPRRRGAAAAAESPLAFAPVRGGVALAPTLPAGPAALASSSPAMFDPGGEVGGVPPRQWDPRTGTAPVVAARTPSAYREPPLPAPPRRASRGLPWRAGAVLALMAAVATTGVLIARQQAASDSTADARTVIDPPPPEPEPRPEPEPEPRPESPEPTPVIADAGTTSVVTVVDASTGTAPEPEAVARRAVKRTGSADDARARPSRRARSARRSERGYLDVAVDPWANLTVDGKSYGQTPKLISLTAGSHKVVLTNNELNKVETVTVKIKSGETRSLDRNWH